MKSLKMCLLLSALSVLGGGPLWAQDPDADAAQAQAADDKVWSGSFGAGFSLTSGNTDTTNLSFSFDALRDPGARNIMKFTGLYLRADQNDEKTADRLRLQFRDEYSYSPRAFLYFDMGYVRDPFKDIDYLLNPQGGLGYKLVDTDEFLFQIDGGAGVVWEKNFDLGTRSDGSINGAQYMEWNLNEGTAVVQQLAALWKMDDFEDALYHFSIGLATQLTSRTSLKVEFIDDFKNKPPDPDTKKNDIAFLTSFLFKF